MIQFILFTIVTLFPILYRCVIFETQLEVCDSTVFHEDSKNTARSPDLPSFCIHIVTKTSLENTFLPLFSLYVVLGKK